MTGTDRWALVTGASEGIGVDLARLFARDGWNLVLVARRRERLETLGAELGSAHGIRAIAIADDLSDPASPDRIADRLAADGVEVSALVNNAGFGLRGRFDETEWDTEHRMMLLNIVSLVHLTKLLLPGMLARRNGRIMNLASTAAFQPGPLVAVYCATKAFVLFFSEAIRHELRGTSVTVTTLCPGPTATGFSDVAAMSGTRLFRFGSVMQSGDVARIGYDGMMKGKGIVVTGLMNRLGAFIVRFAPRGLVMRVVDMVNAT